MIYECITFFNAYSLPSDNLFTLKTVLKAPSPKNRKVMNIHEFT